MEQHTLAGILQQPLHTGFDASSTASDVISGINLTGKIAIVTGGNTGIGLETTKALVAAGARVIVPARDMDKARRNLSGLEGVEIESMDLMDPEAIDDFAKRFLATGRPLHLLINNAGIMWVPLCRDKRGIESQLSSNYLAAFHLTARLWPALKQAGGARVVNVSSQGHQFAAVDFDDPNFLHRDYDTLQAYGQSKTAMNLFSVALDGFAKSFKVRSYALHPGSIAGTELGRSASIELFEQMGFCDASGELLPEVAASLKNVAQGAATTVWCASSPLLEKIGGVYCEDSDIAQLSSTDSTSKGVKSYSLDPANADRLWTISERMTGIRFTVN